MQDKDGEERFRKAVAEVSAEWDRKLAPMRNDPKFGEKVDAMMDADGRIKRRPIAGESF